MRPYVPLLAMLLSAACEGRSDAVTVVVYGEDHVPAVDTVVVFHDADGHVLDARFTDARGRTSSSVLGIAAVTISPVALPGSGLWTTFGIEPGDEIMFDPGTTTREVVLPGALPDAQVYQVSTAVDDDGSPLAEPRTVLDANSGAFVIARAFEGDRAIAYSTQLGPSMASITLDAWRTDVDEVPYAIVGARPDQTQLEATLHVVSPTGRLLPASFGGTSGMAGRLGMMRGLASDVPLVVSAHSGDGFYDQDEVITRVEDRASRSAVRLDLSSVPEVALTWDGAEARPTMRWTTSIPIARATVRLALIAEERGSGWTLVAPGAAGEIRVPELPDELPHRGIGHWSITIDASESDPEWRLHPLGPFPIEHALGAHVVRRPE